MPTELSRIQPLLAFAAGHLDEDLSLTALAGKSGLSPFHLHRVFSAAAGETPKEFTLRLRLDRAAVLLLTTTDSVLDVALACGFASHEVFCRGLSATLRNAAAGVSCARLRRRSGNQPEAGTRRGSCPRRTVPALLSSRHL
jgi:transcriptional regulator GlxA family with amidase domain